MWFYVAGIFALLTAIIFGFSETEFIQPKQFNKQGEELLSACYYGDLKKIEIMLYNEPELIRYTLDNEGCLHVVLQGKFDQATMPGNSELTVIKTLLTKHDNTLLYSKRGEILCPVFHAVRYRNWKAISLMGKYGDQSDWQYCISETDDNGRTALHHAVTSKAAGTARIYNAFALRNQPIPSNILTQLDLQASRVSNPMTYATLTAAQGSKDVAAMLKLGFLCSAVDNYGRNSFHTSAVDGTLQTFKYLLANCESTSLAAVNAPVYGWTTAQLAQLNGHRNIIKVLQETFPDYDFELATKGTEEQHTQVNQYSINSGWEDMKTAEEYDGHGCSSIAKISCSTISKEEFIRKHLVPNQPAILTDCLDGWEAKERWSKSGLLTNYKNEEVDVGEIAYPAVYGEQARRVTIKEFIAMLDDSFDKIKSGKQAATSAPFVFDSRVFDKFALSDTEEFPFLQSSFSSPVLTEWSLGPPLSGANPHFHGEVFSSLVYGRKRWTLSPPAFATFSRETGLSFIRSSIKNGFKKSDFTCFQSSGEVLFVPRNWGHTVLNIKTSASVIFEY